MPSVEWFEAIGNSNVVETSYMVCNDVEINDDMELIRWDITHELPEDNSYIRSASIKEISIEFCESLGFFLICCILQ